MRASLVRAFLDYILTEPLNFVRAPDPRPGSREMAMVVEPRHCVGLSAPGLSSSQLSILPCTVTVNGAAGYNRGASRTVGCTFFSTNSVPCVGVVLSWDPLADVGVGAV